MDSKRSPTNNEKKEEFQEQINLMKELKQILPNIKGHTVVYGKSENPSSQSKNGESESVSDDAVMWFSTAKNFTTQECAICMERFKATDNITQLNCQHVFHISCFFNWLDEQRSCPLCRSDVELDWKDLAY